MHERVDTGRREKGGDASASAPDLLGQCALFVVVLCGWHLSFEKIAHTRTYIYRQNGVRTDLRHQFDLQLAGQKLPLELFVLANIRRDHALYLDKTFVTATIRVKLENVVIMVRSSAEVRAHLLIVEESAEADLFEAGVVADHGEAVDAGVASPRQRVDEVFWYAAEAEAADEQRGGRRYVGDRLVGARAYLDKLRPIDDLDGRAVQVQLADVQLLAVFEASVVLDVLDDIRPNETAGRCCR